MQTQVDATSQTPATKLAVSPVFYVATLILVACISYGIKLANWGIFACPADKYQDAWFLSDCNTREYGDFDHGALWYPLVAKVHDRIHEADVLFVGSSRLQFAFSTDATQNWFEGHDRSYYLLGMSNTENSLFTGPLVEKTKPKARALVINLDSFFVQQFSAPANKIFFDKDAEQHYRGKLRWQSAHQSLCGSFTSLCGDTFAVYRNVDNGRWRYSGSKGYARASEVGTAVVENREAWAENLTLAQQFLTLFEVDEACVFLTVVPTLLTPTDEAHWLAEQLDRPLLTPELTGLRTFDRSHLDSDSAARWSKAFFELAGPQIRNCVNTGPEHTVAEMGPKDDRS